MVRMSVGMQGQIAKRSSNELETQKDGDEYDPGKKEEVEIKRLRSAAELQDYDDEQEIDVETVDEEIEDHRLVIDTTDTRGPISQSEPSNNFSPITSDSGKNPNFSTNISDIKTLCNSSVSVEPMVTSFSSHESSGNIVDSVSSKKHRRKKPATLKLDPISNAPDHITMVNVVSPETAQLRPNPVSQTEVKLFYENALSRLFVNGQRDNSVSMLAGVPAGDDKSLITGPDDALDLSLKSRVEKTSIAAVGKSAEFGIDKTDVDLLTLNKKENSGFPCAILPTICVNEGAFGSHNKDQPNNSRPSVIRGGMCTEKSSGPPLVLSASEPDVQEHFRKSLSSQRVYGASAEVEDHFARALGSTWLELKEALKDTERTTVYGSANHGSPSLFPKINEISK